MFYAQNKKCINLIFFDNDNDNTIKELNDYCNYYDYYDYYYYDYSK